MYRLSNADPRSGSGASLFSGRWKPKGVEVVYTSLHASLAVLEILANVDDLPANYNLTEVRIPDDVHIEHLPDDQLPANWKLDGPYSAEPQTIGALWVSQSRSAVLSVPSKVMWQVPAERNFLLNPAHPGFAAIEFSAPLVFHFDPRLK